MIVSGEAFNGEMNRLVALLGEGPAAEMIKARRSNRGNLLALAGPKALAMAKALQSQLSDASASE